MEIFKSCEIRNKQSIVVFAFSPRFRQFQSARWLASRYRLSIVPVELTPDYSYDMKAQTVSLSRYWG